MTNFIGPRIKIDRAKRHIIDLKAEIDAFHARDPYRVLSHEDSQAGQRVIRVKVIEEIPSSWGAAIGDVVHNLRSSLDLLMNDLVVMAGNQPHRSTQFPVGIEVKELKPSFFEKVRGAEPRTIKLIKRLKPYEGGIGSALWRLHELDIRDKHRLLVPVGAAHRNVIFRPHIPTSDGIELPLLSFAIRPADRQFPLRDGAELYREPLVMAVNTDPQVTLEIAFGDGQIFEGEPVIETLAQLAQAVDRVIGAFDRIASRSRH